MKLFKFFVSKIFLRRIIPGISIILLICLSNYITFTAARTVFSTYQGSQETKELNQDGNYIANLDPNSTVDFGAIDADKTKNVYDYLSSNFDYAFYVDGFMVSIPNHDDMEISLCYMNEAYYELNQFNLSQGTDLTFDYRFDKNNEIPVLIGKGLSKTYPVGSTIDLEDPALGQKITLRVQGVLEQNAYHSNYYTLNSKSYYNFSIILPVNEEFLDHANLGLRVNGLMDIVILQTTEEKISDLRTVIQDTLGLKLNFFGQQDNNEYFNEYYFHSLKIVAVTSVILLLLITGLSVWNALVGIRLMLKDLTINLLVGLSYSKLRKMFYSYFGILFLINLVIVFAITAFNRYSCWLRKDTTFVTYGLFGLIGIDWLSLLAVVFTDIIIGIIVVECMLWRIKKVPISLGVLQ